MIVTAPATPGWLPRLFPRQAGKLTCRLLAMLLVAQSVVVVFGALLARTLRDGGRSGTWFTAILVVALVALLSAAAQRRPGGVFLGWLAQLLTLSCCLIVPMMLPVALVFGGLWVTFLHAGGLADDRLRAFDKST